jgi:hypothetical protein
MEQGWAARIVMAPDSSTSIEKSSTERIEREAASV